MHACYGKCHGISMKLGAALPSSILRDDAEKAGLQGRPQVVRAMCSGGREDSSLEMNPAGGAEIGEGLALLVA